MGIIGKQDRNALETVARLVDWLESVGRVPLLDQRLSPHIDRPAERFCPRDLLAARCDLALVVGGDGTLLAAARVMAPRGVPILGINQGRLGFMVDVPPDAFEAPISAVLSGQHITESRLLLSARVISAHGEVGPLLAINDVVIRNQASIRMLEFDTWLGEQFISQHRADGLIVSSPTGSTAYALSGGGPVMHPSLEAISLVPICPHTLSDRPLVVAADRPIKIRLGGGTGTLATVTCDGQSHEALRPGDELIVERAAFRMQLIHAAGYDYFNVLRNKLHWGRGPN